MRPSSFLVSCIVGIVSVASAAAWSREGVQPAPDRESAVEAFNRQVNSYARLHRRLEAPLVPLDEADEPLHTYASRQILARAIRRARLTVHQGALFSPAVVSVFRETIVDTRDDLRPWLSRLQQQYAIVPDVHPQVNEPCAPSDARELPDVLLRKLPPLAPELQYRLVNFDLVLWDAHAYLVVDFLPDAFRLPERAFT
jgi:hypothetical protein